MSQVNLHEIIRQQQEQLVAMQVQIQALLAVQGGAGGEAEDPTGISHGGGKTDHLQWGSSKSGGFYYSM